ncbi:MAG: hypothetical protein Q9165_007220 [Trypethelium subeluteriae]
MAAELNQPYAPPPPGQTPDFSDNAENRIYQLYIVAGVCLVLVLLFGSARYFAKRRVVKHRTWDDLTCLLGVIGTIAYTTIVIGRTPTLVSARVISLTVDRGLIASTLGLYYQVTLEYHSDSTWDLIPAWITSSANMGKIKRETSDSTLRPTESEQGYFPGSTGTAWSKPEEGESE